MAGYYENDYNNFLAGDDIFLTWESYGELGNFEAFPPSLMMGSVDEQSAVNQQFRQLGL